MHRLLVIIGICLILAGCESVPIKNGELYVNQQTSLGMDDFGVAKVRNKF